MRAAYARFLFWHMHHPKETYELVLVLYETIQIAFYFTKVVVTV